jgi:uncharacterized protein YdhG (YjbR/CyaY superfamily)
MKAGTKSAAAIDDYIQGFPPEARRRLESIRKIVRKLAPDAKEKISYRMPAFHLNGPLLYFAAFKNHIGFYPTAGGVLPFEKELSKYVHGRGSIQFPMDEDLPLKLIEKIVKHRVKESAVKGGR